MKSHHDVNVTVLCFVHCLFFVQCLGFEFFLFIFESIWVFVCLFIHVMQSCCFVFLNFFSSGYCLVFMVFWMPFQMGTACFGSMIFI